MGSGVLIVSSTGINVMVSFTGPLLKTEKPKTVSSLVVFNRFVLLSLQL